MRLLRQLLAHTRRSRASTRYALSQASPELDYDPLVTQLANQCR
ncbi:MAG: hypothetical protein V4808_16690 [Pseudomonadota bacterium]